MRGRKSKKSKKSKKQAQDKREVHEEGACGGELESVEKTDSPSTASSRDTPESGNSRTGLIQTAKKGKPPKGSSGEKPAATSSKDSPQPCPQKNEDSTQPSSSSGPGVEKAKSEQLCGENLLDVPGQSTTRDRSKSPIKTFVSAVINWVSPKKTKTTKEPSDSGCSCKTKSNHEKGCPLRKRTDENAKKTKSNSRSQTESETSSSSPSLICKKGTDISASSEASTSSSSKSSSCTGAIPKVPGRHLRKDLSRSPRRLETIISPPPTEPTDNDPLIETETPEILDGSNRMSRLLVPRIDLDGQVRSKRAESFGSYFKNYELIVRDPSPYPQRKTKTEFLKELGEREDAMKANRARRAVQEGDTESDRTDEEGQVRKREQSSPRVVPTVRRHESASPTLVRKCDCNKDKKVILHKIGCHRNIDARRRKMRRRCRQSVPSSSEDDPKETGNE